jgi:hypothetical protein
MLTVVLFDMVDDRTDNAFPFRPHGDLVVAQRPALVEAPKQYLFLANTFGIAILARSVRN